VNIIVSIEITMIHGGESREWDERRDETRDRRDDNSDRDERRDRDIDRDIKFRKNKLRISTFYVRVM